MLRTLAFLFCWICFEKAGAQPVYHILSTDTNFYHWVGTPDEIYRSRNKIACDCSYAVWERRPDAPDGIYYIYYPYDRFNYTYPDPARKDTITYEVTEYKGGKPAGTSKAYYWHEKIQVAEFDYTLGYLSAHKRYDFFPAGYSLPQSSRGCCLSQEFTYPYGDPDMIIKQNLYDSLGRETYASAKLVTPVDTILIFEEKMGYGPTGDYPTDLYVVNYFPNSEHSKAFEMYLEGDKLTHKYWCKNGTLFHHTESTIVLFPGGTWETYNRVIIFSLLEGDARRYHQTSFYCSQQ